MTREQRTEGVAQGPVKSAGAFFPAALREWSRDGADGRAGGR